jgi:hypothetical protein
MSNFFALYWVEAMRSFELNVNNIVLRSLIHHHQPRYRIAVPLCCQRAASDISEF